MADDDGWENDEEGHGGGGGGDDVAGVADDDWGESGAGGDDGWSGDNDASGGSKGSEKKGQAQAKKGADKKAEKKAASGAATGASGSKAPKAAAAADDDDFVSGGADDGGEDMSTEVQVANIFYEAEDMNRDNPKGALEKFRKVMELTKSLLKTPAQIDSDEMKMAIFKSMLHICVLEYGNKKYDAMTSTYQQLLEWLPHVTRNDAAEAIETVLNSMADSQDFKVQQQMYGLTSAALSKMPDLERLLFDIQMKLCRSYVARDQWKDAQALLINLHKTCTTPDGQDDKSKGTQLLEIYALQLRISGAQDDIVKKRELFDKTKDIITVKDPRSQSIIRECWAEMYGDEGQWLKSKPEFFTAFTNYDEIGNAAKAKSCIKGLVVAHILSGQLTNPFEARELKVYQMDKEVEAVSQLRTAFERCDMSLFARAMDEIRKSKDTFIIKHLGSVEWEFHCRTIQTIIKSYRRIRLQHLAQYLRIPIDRVEELLIHLIHDGAVIGRIDQVAGVLDLSQRAGGGQKKWTALSEWARAVDGLVSTLPQPVSSSTRQRLYMDDMPPQYMMERGMGMGGMLY